jgi:hypothetical protein
MASVTLAESAKLSQDFLVQGVIENIITVDRFFDVLPFDGISGNALAYDRENALGTVATVGVGDADGSIGAGATGTNSTERAAAKDPATFTQVTSTLTTIMGDAEVNGLIQATRSNQNNQTSVQIASKSKAAGRKFRDMLINGDGTNFTFAGLIALCADGQITKAGGGATNGAALAFEDMDAVMDLVVDKDGQVDYLAMHARTLRSYKALLRALGGANIGEVVQLPSGAEVPAYSGVPIFRNDYMPTDQTKGSDSTCTSVLAGTLDDGSRKQGIAGLTADSAAGLMVEDVGVSQTKDERIWRVKWYCGLALFSEKGLAMLTEVTN